MNKVDDIEKKILVPTFMTEWEFENLPDIERKKSMERAMSIVKNIEGEEL